MGAYTHPSTRRNTVYTSSVVGLGIDEVWTSLSSFDSVVPFRHSSVSHVALTPSSPPASSIGAVRVVSYDKETPPERHTLLSLSASSFVLRWRVESGGETPSELDGAVCGIALTRITESNATHIALSLALQAPEKGAVAQVKKVAQVSLCDLRMHLQNNHELIRVRFRPYTRPHLLLQAVSDALLAVAADALRGNTSVSSLTLARGSLSATGLGSLLPVLGDPAALGLSLRSLSLSSLSLPVRDLAAFLTALGGGDKSSLATLKILGSTLSDQSALEVLTPALEALADAVPSLTQIEVHVGYPTAAILPPSVTNRIQRNRMLSLDDPSVLPALHNIDLVTNALIDSDLASRAARALQNAPNLRSLWIHDAGAPTPALHALIRAIKDIPSLEAVRISRTRRQALTPPFLAPLLEAIPDSSVKVLELVGLDLSSGSPLANAANAVTAGAAPSPSPPESGGGQGEGDALDSGTLPEELFLVDLIKANGPLEVFLAPQVRPVPDKVLVSLASAVSESNSHLLVLELASSSGILSPSRALSALPDGSPSGMNAFAKPGYALLAAALLSNRDAAVRDLVRRVEASDEDLTVLSHETLVDDHSLVACGLADALRSNHRITTIRHFHLTDAAAVAIADALLDNPRSSVSLIQLDGALSSPTCAAFTHLIHQRESLSVSLGPANPYVESSRSFVHTPHQ